jgi:hypothetical protein
LILFNCGFSFFWSGTLFAYDWHSSSPNQDSLRPFLDEDFESEHSRDGVEEDFEFTNLKNERIFLFVCF